MRFVVCYDVSDNRKRNKIARMLKAHGIRTQKSVFEISADVRTVMLLLEEVEKIIDPIDKFFVYPVKEEDCKNIIRLGVAVKTYFEIIH